MASETALWAHKTHTTLAKAVKQYDPSAASSAAEVRVGYSAASEC